MTFAELNLLPAIQKAISQEGYTTPTPIQAQTLPHLLEGRDVLGSAQTGTGKTAAFALPILNHLGKQNRKSIPGKPFALILAPTRELAGQIRDSFAAYGRHLKLRYTTVYGGVGQARQVHALNKGVHVLIATPGRLLDLIGQGHISLDQLEIFVLDEADRMLDMGFLPDLKRIIDQLPPKRQSLFFSATLPPRIIELSNHLLTSPIKVDVTPEKSNAVELIDQHVLFVDAKQKTTVLKQVLSEDHVGQTLVFTRTKRGANLLTEQLLKAGIQAGAIHGNKSQNARERVLQQFRQVRLQVLVATDVAARGIDIDGITHVVNFDLPNEPESYVHRIGRTGRAGAKGTALSLCSIGERGELRAIEKLLGDPLPIHPEFQPTEEFLAAEKLLGKGGPRGRSGGNRGFRPKTNKFSKPGNKQRRPDRSSGPKAKSQRQRSHQG